MRFFHDTKIRFMKYRWHWITASTVLNLAALGIIMFGPGFKFGVDFAGGTQLTLKFRSDPDLGRVRRALESLKIGTVSIQRIGENELHEFLIRMQNPERTEGDFAAAMVKSLDGEFNQATSAIKLNLQGSDALRDTLASADPDQIAGSITDRQAHYKPMADGILTVRKKQGILAGIGDLRSAGLSPAVATYLTENARFGEFSLLAADNVGPLVGKDLRQKAFYAVAFSLLGMLIYIWFRFKLQYGVGAIIANFHDVIITLGVLSLTGKEIEIPTIAALLTLVGYSVNDTVIIFDRIRELLKLERGKPLADVMDDAINKTLSRTVITSGLTWLVVLSLFLFGGHVIHTFAFTLLVGIIVGTYSSIYVASPFALGVSNWLEKRKRSARRR
ncbi:MAG: protein translocase subunit SecF [Acidobacteria bacterium]|nr:protein translocase subunit SecF [Acidobacteriota bacterium]